VGLNARLLLVEDDPAVRRSLAETLEAEGVEVHSACTAEEALDRLAEVAPEVVTDVRMPGMGGLSLLRLLRERVPDVDVVVMTAFDEMPIVVQAMRDGAFELIVKPCRLPADARCCSPLGRENETMKAPLVKWPGLMARSASGAPRGRRLARLWLHGCLVTLALPVLACTPSEYIAEYGLRPVGSATLNGAPAPGALSPFVFDGADPVPAVRYQDERVAVDWILSSRRARLDIENRTDAPLRVIWSESRLEGDFQTPLILAEAGTRHERSLPQEPTVIPPAGRVTYRAIAAPPGRWTAFTNDQDRGFWQSARSIFDLDVDGASERGARIALAERAVGMELRLVLPLEIAGSRYELELPVRVSGASVRGSYY
jgi:CheY-like chemotaxis protein